MSKAKERFDITKSVNSSIDKAHKGTPDVTPTNIEDYILVGK